jgi:Tol biopolymer transport system component
MSTRCRVWRATSGAVGTAATLAAMGLALGGCGGGGGGAPTGTSPPATPPPPIALVDSVDYDALGSGRLCFERLVSSGSGGGVFVIDAGARRAWGFAAGQEPAISPDGLRIAYSSYGSFSTNWDIFVMPADGGYPHSHAAGPGIESLPAWTPGSELLWSDSESSLYLESQSREAVSVTGARVVSAYGGLQMRRGSSYVTLVSGGAATRLEAPAFSPDGTELAWVRVRLEGWAQTSMDVVVADPDGGHPETIATLPLPGGPMSWVGNANLSLAWSPDGRRLAFNRPESPEHSTTGHVFVVSRDGGPPTQVTSAPGVGDRSVSWSYLPRP